MPSFENIVRGELCVFADEDAERDILSCVRHNLTAFRGNTLNISKHDCVNKLAILYDVQLLLEHSLFIFFKQSRIQIFLNSGL